MPKLEATVAVVLDSLVAIEKMKDAGENEISVWIEKQLFPEEFLREEYFESTVTLFSVEIKRPLIETLVHHSTPRFDVSKQQVSQCLLETCQELSLIAGAYWFHVNVHDNVARVVEGVGVYSYRQLLFPLYERLEYSPAEQGGTSYVGLLGKQKDWLLLIELENKLNIVVYGSTAFCQRIKQKIETTVTNTKHERSAGRPTAKP